MIKKTQILFIFLFSLSVFTEVAIASQKFNTNFPSWYPKTSCEKKWKSLEEKGLSQYSYQTDSEFSEVGNIGYEKYARRVEREKCLKDWTVLVYMAADNDLSPYSLWDIHEMETKIKGELNLGASTNKTDVLIELDTLRDTGVRRLHVFQTEEDYQEDLRLEDFEKMDERFIKSPIVKIFPENDQVGRLQSAEKRFKRFLSWGVQNYPSKKYMIVIWGHGEGFLGKFHEPKLAAEKFHIVSQSHTHSDFFKSEDFNLEPFSLLSKPKSFDVNKAFGGVAFDYSDKSFIDISTLGEILDEWKEKLLEGRNFDLLTFDACLMQSLEVMTEVARSTNFIAGSNQIQNYLGLPYRKVLDQLNKGDISAFDLAKALPIQTEVAWSEDGYQRNIDSQGFESFTMSTITSGQIEESLYFHLHKISLQLLSYLKEDNRRKTELQFLIENAPRFQGEMIDLGLFYGLLERLLFEEKNGGRFTAKSEMLKQTVSEARFRLREVFAESRFGPLYYDSSIAPQKNYLLGYFNGLSVWLPKNERLYHQRKSEMRESSLHKSVTSWNHLLEELYKVDLFDLGPL